MELTRKPEVNCDDSVIKVALVKERDWLDDAGTFWNEEVVIETVVSMYELVGTRTEKDV